MGVEPDALEHGALLYRWQRQSVKEVSALAREGVQGEAAQADHLREHQSPEVSGVAVCFNSLAFSG